MTAIRPSKNVTIKENNIMGNGVGNITRNKDFLGGLALHNHIKGSFYIYGNNITDNIGFGVQFEDSNNCLVYNNNIIRNDFGIKLANFEIVNKRSYPSDYQHWGRKHSL